jgi:hypothetical protein
VDGTYGAPRFNRVGSRCALGADPYRFEQCGFRNGIDTNNLEVKNLYVDFRIPQLPLGNRWQVGGIPANVTPLHPYLLYTIDAGGGSVNLDFTDQVSILLHYIQLEEDLDRFRGSPKVGEDYIAAMTLMLKPIPGLDLHLLGVYGHLQAPFGPNLLVDTGGECLCCLQGGKRGAARLRPWSPRQPLPQPHKVQGRSRRQMLEMGLGEPHIARLPEATPTDALRVGTLDACPRGILPLKCFGCLLLPRSLQRLILLALLESYEAWFLLCPGTLRPVETRRAILSGKAYLPCHAILVGVWEPGDALLTEGAGNDLAIPIDQKL